MKVDHKSFVEVVFHEDKAVTSFIKDNNLSFVDYDPERDVAIFADSKDRGYEFTYTMADNIEVSTITKTNINIAAQRLRRNMWLEQENA